MYISRTKHSYFANKNFLIKVPQRIVKIIIYPNLYYSPGPGRAGPAGPKRRQECENKAHAGLWVINRLAGSDRPKHNALDLMAKNPENLNSILNIFQETHDFWVLKDSVTISIYLRINQRKFLLKKHQQTFSWPGERPSSHPKVLVQIFKDLVQKLNIFRDHSLQIFVAGKLQTRILGNRVIEFIIS